MNTRKWIFVAVGAVALVVVIGLVAAVTLVPRVLAQGPIYGYGPGYARGFMARGDFGPGYRMGPGRGFAPQFEMGPRWGDRFGPGYQMGPGRGFGPGFGLGRRGGGPAGSLFAVAAEQLDMTPTELMTELQAGKSIADVAAEHEVALNTIVDAFMAPYAERLAELVTNEVLTQEQVDTLLTAAKAHVALRLSETWASPENCPGFVDEDGDGICDCAGSGQGSGYRGRWPMGRWVY